jgi:hypothetical protein
MQYLEKFNHLSQYAVDHVNTDVKRRDCFLRGLSFKLQKKTTTCYDLMYHRAISVATAVEEKGRVHQNAKRMWKGSGARSSQDPAKRQTVIIRTAGSTNTPYRPTAYPAKTPIYIRPTNTQRQPLPTNSQVPRLPAPTGTKYCCYNYGKAGHFIKDCPYPCQNNSNFQRPAGNSSQNQNKNTFVNNTKGKYNRKTKRVFYTQVDMTLEGNPVLMGTFLIAHHFAKVLFDTGASHTFIS